MTETNNNIPEIKLWQALIPIVFLVALLLYNVVFVYGDDALGGSNQFILLLGAAVAGIIGFFNKVRYKNMLDAISDNIKSTSGAIIILLLVGSLTGTWLISGVIPSMIYYGLQILNPSIFLPATVIICAIISIASGSSWTTTATVGVALVGIGSTLGISSAMTAGAVISGAYFGDKMSPLSDTTNLAAAVAGADLFSHIKYMSMTTVPSFVVTLIVFIILSFTIATSAPTETIQILEDITKSFYIGPVLFLIPVAVIVLIVKKVPPVVAMLLGTLLGALFALIFQGEIIKEIAQKDILEFNDYYKVIMDAITISTSVSTENETLKDLFSAKGMAGMLGTIWLIICALVFGGVMEAIGALAKISKALLSMADSVLGLFASTVASCLAINLTASDQYLAIVVPGKMFSQAYKEKGLAPENLSRTLEDSGTVTSALIPWNTCGAYHSSVLGVDVLSYAVYAVFNYVSPFVTLLFAAFSIKIKTLNNAQA